LLPMEDAARDAYGRLRTSLERQGERIGAHDMLIAAHAVELFSPRCQLFRGNIAVRCNA
jgi:predicted nucleic acid-binding protein